MADVICSFFVPPHAPPFWRAIRSAMDRGALGLQANVPRADTRYNLCWHSRLRLRPMTNVFPTHWALGILTRSKPTAALVAPGVQ